MSLFGSLNIGMRGLHASQVAIDVVGQNISNANTNGRVGAVAEAGRLEVMVAAVVALAELCAEIRLRLESVRA